MASHSTFSAGRILLLAGRAGWRLLLLTALLAWFGASWLGLPPPLARRALDRWNRGGFSVEARRMALDFRGGLVAHDLRVYRKGLVSGPLLSARTARLQLDPLAWRKGRMLFGRLTLADGAVDRRLADAWHAAETQRGATGVFDVWARRFDVAGVWVDSLAAVGWYAPDAWEVSELRLGIGRAREERGSARARLSVRGSQFRGRLEMTTHPRWLLPVCEWAHWDWAPALIRRFEFGSDLPVLDIEAIREGGGAVAQWRVRGSFQGSRFRYQEVPISFANLQMEWAQNLDRVDLSLNPVVLVFSNGHASGQARLDLIGKTVDFTMTADAEAPALGRVIGLPDELFSTVFVPQSPCRVYARGLWDYGAGERSAFQGNLQTASARLGTTRLEEVTLDFEGRGRTNALLNAQGRLYGGVLTASAFFWPDQEGTNTRYKVAAEVLHANAGLVAAELGLRDPDRYEGRVNGDVELTGSFGEGPTEPVKGRGYLNVRGGRVYRLPVFGGFSEAMGRAVPGLDYVLSQNDARIPFSIEGRRLATEDARIEGPVLSLRARGWCDMDGRLDFLVQVTPMKEQTLLGQAMHAVTMPLSKLFELRLEGTLEEPRWRSARMPGGRDRAREADPRNGKDGSP